MASDRPDGAKRNRSSLRLRGSARTFSPTLGTSPWAGRVLLVQRRQLELAKEDDLVLELDAVLLPGAAARRRHQRNRISRPRPVRVFDEVGMARRDLGAADPVALQAARLEQASGRQLVLWILEDAAVRALVRRLRRLALCLEARHDRLDLIGRSRRQPELDLGYHLARPQTGAPVAQTELGGRAPLGPARAHDQGTFEDRGPVASVCACVHPDPAAGRAGDRAGELEPAEAGGAGAMQRDRVRRPASGDEELAANLGLRQGTGKLEHEAA